jgi:hypothetical protein
LTIRRKAAGSRPNLCPSAYVITLHGISITVWSELTTFAGAGATGNRRKNKTPHTLSLHEVRKEQPSGSLHIERCIVLTEETPMSISREVGLALVASLFLTLPALTQEKKIGRSDLPPAVEKAVAAQSQGATIRGFSEEKENGQTFYEAELVVNDHSKDILMDLDGVVLEVEEQIALNSLSAAVRDGLQAKAGKGKFVKVESLTKKDKLVGFEAQVVTDGKTSEVQVGPDGKPLDHQE